MRSLEAVVVIACAAAITLPHALRLHRVSPLLAAMVWFYSLCVRALVSIGAAIFVLLYLPQTGLYDAVVQWCWHEALPLVATHLGLSGHPLVHAAIILPGLALAGSMVWALFGFARAWLAVRRRLRGAVGQGPHGSTIIEDSDIVVGVTGVGRSRILISDGAVGALDAEELEASVNHELGHIQRRHRPVLLFASVLGALGRTLPGTRKAEAELRFSLERDADQYAVRRTRDPLALASAICKAATGHSPAGALGLEGSGRVSLRLDYLEGVSVPAAPGLERAVRALALVLILTTLGLLAAVPSWALAAPSAQHTMSTADASCPEDGGH